MSRKVILYVATSVDGYISAPHDDLAFLSSVQKAGEDYGYADFISTIDTVILGRRTYDWVTSQVPFPHADKETFVMTRSNRPSVGNVTFYNGNLKELVTGLKRKAGKNIFCDGGAEIIHQLLIDDLIDEFIISIIPILLGNGIKLFKDFRPPRKLELLEAKSFDTGLAQLHYQRKT